MAKIAAVLDRLVREVGRFDPDFTLRPETPERIAAAEKCMGEPLPDGYREFLERIGRTKWPCVIGNVVDHRTPELPPRFVPFGRRADHAFDTVVFVRRSTGGPDPNIQLRADLKQMIASKKEELDDEERGPDSDLEGHIAQLEDELEEAEAAPPMRTPNTKNVPIEWCERERGRLQSAPEWYAAGPWQPSPDASFEESIMTTSFADWLNAELNLWLTPRTEPEPVSTESLEAEQTRILLQALIAGGALELADTFDEDAAVLLLSPAYGDSERFYEILLDCPGIEEVFISEDDIEIRFEGPRSL